jgi:hypothetical protein
MTAFNLIVLAITLLMAAFLFTWARFPRLRPWIEAPKYRVLTWEERFPKVVRPLVDGEPSSGQARWNDASGER